MREKKHAQAAVQVRWSCARDCWSNHKVDDLSRGPASWSFLWTLTAKSISSWHAWKSRFARRSALATGGARVYLSAARMLLTINPFALVVTPIGCLWSLRRDAPGRRGCRPMGTSLENWRPRPGFGRYSDLLARSFEPKPISVVSGRSGTSAQDVEYPPPCPTSPSSEACHQRRWAGLSQYAWHDWQRLIVSVCARTKSRLPPPRHNPAHSTVSYEIGAPRRPIRCVKCGLQNRGVGSHVGAKIRLENRGGRGPLDRRPTCYLSPGTSRESAPGHTSQDFL